MKSPNANINSYIVVCEGVVFFLVVSVDGWMGGRVKSMDGG